MAGEQLSALRAHPAVIVSVVAAAVTVTACALVGIAYMLGWVPLKSAPLAPAAAASPPAASSAGATPGIALLPGESLVLSPEPPAAATPRPATPNYERASPAPAAKASPPPSPKAATPPSYAQAPPSRAAPSRPSYLPPEDVAPRSYDRATRNICVNCGSIRSIASFGDEWEVRVRFEDGTSETLRYPERPRFRVGERVRLEDGRLVPD